MRRSLVIGGVLILAVLILADRLGSQPKPPQAPRTRMGLVNMAQVLRDYVKVAALTAENQKLLKPYQEKLQDLKEQIDAHTKALEQKDLSEESRAQHQKKLKARQRELEDVSNDYKVQFAKKNEEQMTSVYKEVAEAAQALCQGQGP